VLSACADAHTDVPAALSAKSPALFSPLTFLVFTSHFSSHSTDLLLIDIPAKYRRTYMVEHSLSIAEDPEPDIDPDIRRRSISHNHNQQQQHQAQPAQLQLPPQLPPLAGADGTIGEGTTVDFASISPNTTTPSHKNVVDAGAHEHADRADRADLDWAEKGTVGEDDPHHTPEHHLTLAPVRTGSQLGSIEERAGSAGCAPDQGRDDEADEADDKPVQPSWGTSIKVNPRLHSRRAIRCRTWYLVLGTWHSVLAAQDECA
jgi:hypothetical protein